MSASPLKVSIQFVKVATTKSQTPPKISPAPCQTRSQSPVNIPANTSKSPTSTSSTTPRILLICWNTPSNTGASSSQKPFQTALSTSVMSSNSKPSSLSRSVIACPNSSNLAFIPSQIAVILALNSSLFFQRFAKARISAAMAAPTASAGADMSPMAPITPWTAPFAMVSFWVIDSHLIAAITTPRALNATPSSGRWPSSHSIPGITEPVTNWTAERRDPSKRSYILRPSSSHALFICARSPERLSFIIAAISSAVPLAPRRLSSYPAILSMPSLRIRFRPLVESAVKVEDRATARSASPMPFVAASTSVRMSVRSRKLPSASMTATEVSPILIWPSSMAFVMSRMIAARAVPASLPL